MASSEELHKRRVGAVARGVGSVIPSYVDTATGGTVTDVEGREWIDFAAGIAVTNVGNSAPKVVEAVRAQVERFTHTCFMVAPYESYVAVCEQLNALTPGGFEKRSALFNSGAEAVENAVKIARHATGRPAVVVFDHAYHGRTNLTMALTAKNMPYKHRFGPFAGEIYRVPMSYPLRDGGLDGATAAARAVELIEKQVGAENVAALLIEPIQGEGGFVVPAPGFLPALRTWATAAGVVFVADEIQTGFCRTGDWFACQHEGVEPDLITLAKGIAGGLPLAAVTGRAELMDAVHVGGLGGTYGGNPIACAAALAAIETLHELDLAAAARRIGAVLGDRLRAVAARDPRIAEVRGRGAMLAVEIVRPGSLTPDPAATAAISAACHAAGLLTLTCGTYGNVLRFLPPLVISDDELARGLDILDAAFG
ncbi:4-aminobutyrate--2-oxoglutarate transaminase [Micromonospora radicis]|uniref:(S)-3-amino-2-methylpropionate transaminase n=1 Tax=Micromonospora radicis TaxID=1894971 RepID=A0A418MQ36_9ACTN|nr:4-aminobutyrate--2-oxoglutarate transaminase [Micromonospora radicis]RIV34624.1 4-aminobutyrate--2-oxoglutarate transaminase [Micromonospora radicis]